jgi:hypothetical protein
MSFDVMMDWSCVKVNPNVSSIVNERPHNAAKFGSDNEKQGPKDI